MSKCNNRNRGLNYERECASKLRTIFPNIVTTRAANRLLDAKKVDLCNEDGSKLPINFQCKTTTTSVQKVLKSMPTNELNVILHKKTEKVNRNFVKKYEVAILSIQDLLKLTNYEIVNDLNLKDNIVKIQYDEFYKILLKWKSTFQ